MILEFLLALLTTATVGALLWPLLRPRAPDPIARLDNDLAIYHDQLAELQKEREAGTLSDSEASAATTEIARRILQASDSSGPRAPGLSGAEGSRPASSSFFRKALPAALCLLIPAFALGTYLNFGAPQLPAQPFADRTPSTARPQQTASLPDLITRARARLAAAPGDPEAMSSLAELLTAEAQGTVTKEARELFETAARTDPDDPRAGFYLGLHQAQSGDSRAALERWLALAARHPADAPFQIMLKAEIERVAKDAKLPVPEIRTQPAAGPMLGAPSAPGPNQDQVEAMGRLTPEQRQQAIRSMVDGLAEKLKDNPQDRDGWLRLARARMVLGQSDQSAEALAKADQIKPLDARGLADWAEALVRQIQPGTPPSKEAVAVLTRLEQVEPRNGLALFYLGAADFAEGRKADAARRWKTLLAMLPGDAPIRAMLEAKIRETE
jgi:cytochrome c-type biogenesis protein CcmH